MENWYIRKQAKRLHKEFTGVQGTKKMLYLVS